MTKHVAVAGSGATAWIAALGLARAFRSRGLRVTLIDTGPDAEAPRGHSTLPSQRGIHGLLGIGEPELVRRAAATYKLGSEHAGWQGEGSSFVHAHGEIGRQLGDLPFYNFLLNEQLAGRAESPEVYSLAATAARLGRFAHPMGSDDALTASFTYGFHIEEAGYVALLRESAQRAGVQRVEGASPVVTRHEDGRIASLQLGPDLEVAADLFIDCTGLAARVLSQISDGAREDWSANLPCDRMWTAVAPPMADPPAATQTRATGTGWTWRLPLVNSTLVGQVFSGALQSEDAAKAELSALAPQLRDFALRRWSTGRRRRFWEHNCVALGSAALQLEPLAGADLHFAQLGLVTLIELLPLDARSRVESAEYDRVMGEHAAALRDFTLAHYRVGRAPAGEFWQAVRGAPLPDRLAQRLDLFAANGRLVMQDFESFEELDWAWLLLGAGVRPDALELQIRQRMDAKSAREFAPLREQVRQLAASMPRHLDFLKRVASAQPRGA